MKKLSAILATAAAALCLFAAEVVEFRNASSEFNAPRGGKLTRVEVFSTNTTGSVTLKSVWTAPVFTNAVQIETFTATNVTVVSSNRVDATVATNAYPAADFTFGKWQRAHALESLISSNAAVSVTATTNTWPVFKSNVSVTNAIISGGSLSGNKYGGAPSSDTWIAPGERLIYEGPKGGFIRLILE